MASAYQDVELRSRYIELLRRAKEETTSSAEVQLSYYLSIFEKAHQSLAEPARQVGKGLTVPDVIIYPPDDDDEARDLYLDQQGIRVGLGLLWELEGAVLAFTQFLLRNYWYQIAPIMGDVPPLSQVVSPGAFPLEALQLYAANLIPEAIARDGYEKRPFQSIMEFLQTVRHARASPEKLPGELSRRLAKPPLDLRLFLRHFDLNEAIDQYFDQELGPYYLALNYQLMLDAVHFMLAHEMAHFLLGHHSYMASDLSQARAEEVQADKLALQFLQHVPGFQLRSLLALFGFFHLAYETSTSLTLLDHPFSRDRMLILCATVLQDPQGEALRSDINVGMSMLNTPLEPILVAYRWEDGFEEDIVAYAYHYSDMDYAAHLFLYLERPPYSAEIYNGARENAFLLSCLDLEMHLVLRDRIHPETTIYRGRVLLRPGLSPKGDLFVHDQHTPMCRLHTRLVAPPEWWLVHPNTVLTIESINPAAESLPEPEDVISSVLKYDMERVELDYASYLLSLPSPDEDLNTRAAVLLAARRFHEENRPDLAVLFYEWLYRWKKQMLLYPDLIDLAFDLIQLNRLPDAARIAQRALSEDRIMRPGFHLVLALDFSDRGLIQEAMEHAFLELFGIGEFGEYIEQAKMIYASLLEGSDDPVMYWLRQFHLHYGSAEACDQPEQATEALWLFRQAYQDLAEAIELAQDDFVFLCEYAAETLMAICALEGQGFQPAKEAFEAICQLAPRFVPAQVQLARIVLLEDDLPRAHALWMRANDLMPSNHFVFNFRELVEEPRPDIVFESRPVEELFRPPDSNDQTREEKANGRLDKC